MSNKQCSVTTPHIFHQWSDPTYPVPHAFWCEGVYEPVVTRGASRHQHDTTEFVLVPERLARVIRVALDHGDQAHDLAEQLIACEGYRIDKEPWEQSQGAPGAS